MITKENNSEVLKKFSTHPGDTGSPQVQIALITKRIKHISGHIQAHKKDRSSERGLLGLVGQRRRLLNYLRKKDLGAYGAIIKQLELRK